jgi:hypothetical protein
VLDLVAPFIEYAATLSGVAPTPSALLSCGKFIEFAHSRVQFYGLRLPGAFELVGSEAGAADYRAVVARFVAASKPMSQGGGMVTSNANYADEMVQSQTQTPVVAATVDGASSEARYGGGGGTGMLPDKCHGRTYARVGLMGNPSDGYFGRTLAATIRNFHADVWLVKSDSIKVRTVCAFDI